MNYCCVNACGEKSTKAVSLSFFTEVYPVTGIYPYCDEHFTCRWLEGQTYPSDQEYIMPPTVYSWSLIRVEELLS